MLVARRVTKKFQFESPNCLLGCTRYVVSRFIVQDQRPSSKHHHLFMWIGSPELRSSMWHYWLHQTFANTEAVAIDIRISIHGQLKHACWWHVLKDEIRALQLYYAIVKWHSFPIFYDNLSVQFLRGWPLKVGPLGWPGTLIRHYYSTASNIPRIADPINMAADAWILKDFCYKTAGILPLNGCTICVIWKWTNKMHKFL